jgi:protein-S-isoprenylcysteine O-methyltransferase Ste14
MVGPTPCARFIGWLWVILITYWMISAIGAKHSIRSAPAWRPAAGLRLVGVIALVLFALRIPLFRQALQNARGFGLVTTNPLLGPIGAALSALGMGLAIWARLYLGRNWGMPMSRKESPELVITGPYAVVRHPIYGGLILAFLGSALGQSPAWIALLIWWGPYFIYSARSEERSMMQQFPDQYPAYKRRTKMFVPFVL